MSVFVVTEHAGMQSAPVLRDDLLAALDTQPAVTLDLSGVVETDLSFLQLIEAARREAKRRGKSLILAAPADGVVRATLSRAGFLTDPAGDATAFWLHGETAQ